MTYVKNLLAVCLLLPMCMACQKTEENKSEGSSTTPSVENPAPPASADVAMSEAGKKVYDQYCLVCHQADGNGVPNAFPPLVQTDWVTGDKERLIGLVLNGMSGPIEVNGETYNNVMTAHNFLSDEEVAAVLTYVRSNFGNQASPVTANEVAAVRAGG